MRRIDWPHNGVATVLVRHMALGALPVLMVLAAINLMTYAYARAASMPLLLVSMSALLVSGAVIHNRALKAARKAEIIRSFAGLSVIHGGHSVKVDTHPRTSIHVSRADAVRTAFDHGGWSVIVKAYDAWYLLSGTHIKHGSHPVAFRTRAVADLVPSISTHRAS